jgi:hypothetical protein
MNYKCYCSIILVQYFYGSSCIIKVTKKFAADIKHAGNWSPQYGSY